MAVPRRAGCAGSARTVCLQVPTRFGVAHSRRRAANQGVVGYGLARPGEEPGAVGVWRAANLARGRLPPTPERVARIHEKLTEPARLLVVGRADAEVVAMALAEPGLADDGDGPAVVGLGHVAVVFVAPGHRGRGVGTGLMAEPARGAGEVGWNRFIIWTGVAIRQFTVDLRRG